MGSVIVVWVGVQHPREFDFPGIEILSFLEKNVWEGWISGPDCP